MSEIIEYSNPKLEEQIKNILGNSYGALQPIIVDTLLKRNIVFKLTDEQTVAETQRILDNLERFEIGEVPNRMLGICTVLGTKNKN